MDLLNLCAREVTTSSFNLTLFLMIVVSVVLYALSCIHRNYSWVDRSWSIAPVVYTWIHVLFNSKGLWATAPTDNAAVFYAIIITIWGIRLTFNFARRGGYRRGGEDYRWQYVRSQPEFSNPIVWEVYSFWMIAVFQTALLWAITLPVITIPSQPVSLKDGVFGFVLTALIVLEALCDEQQQRFQRAKRESPHGNKQDGLLSYGFCISGVFGHSRHLNVFCEGSIWVTLAVVALAHGQMMWWQAVGCVVLELLTFYSTAYITEKLSTQKYPLYRVYQATTPMLIPSIKSSTSRTHYLLRRESRVE